MPCVDKVAVTFFCQFHFCMCHKRHEAAPAQHGSDLHILYSGIFLAAFQRSHDDPVQPAGNDYVTQTYQRLDQVNLVGNVLY